MRIKRGLTQKIQLQYFKFFYVRKAKTRDRENKEKF